MKKINLFELGEDLRKKNVLISTELAELQTTKSQILLDLDAIEERETQLQSIRDSILGVLSEISDYPEMVWVDTQTKKESAFDEYPRFEITDALGEEETN